jgi:hypothetical protein
MAIRLRTVNGIRVALCAVESDPLPGDLYLDDADHHALSNKFGLDWQAMGFITNPPIDEDVAAMMATQKLRDAGEVHAAWSKSTAQVRWRKRDKGAPQP